MRGSSRAVVTFFFIFLLLALTTDVSLLIPLIKLIVHFQLDVNKLHFCSLSLFYFTALP